MDFQKLSRQVPGFALVGAARTLFSLLVYWGLILLLPYWLSFTISFFASLVLSAIVSSRFVFITRLTATNLAAYGAAYVINYLMSLGLLILAVEVIGVGPAFAPFLVIPFMFPFNFLAERWTLSLRQQSPP